MSDPHSGSESSDHPEPDHSRVVIRPDPPYRLIAICVVSLAFLGFFVFAILSFSEQVKSLGKRGIIVDKEFIAQPETQITVGKRGIEKEEMDGQYILRVKVEEDGAIYSVWVSKPAYESRKIGDSYFVPIKKDKP